MLNASALSDTMLLTDLSKASEWFYTDTSVTNGDKGSADDGYSALANGNYAGWDGYRPAQSDNIDGKVMWFVDLGSSMAVDAITLNWEGAYAIGYSIDMFDEKPDNTTPVPTDNTVTLTNDGAGDKEHEFGKTLNGRYLRIRFTQNGPYGIRFRNVKLYTDGSEPTSGILYNTLTGGTTLVKGVSSPLKTRLYKDGVLLGETDNITVTSENGEFITIDGANATGNAVGNCNLTFTFKDKQMGATLFSVIDLDELKKKCLVSTTFPKAEIIDITPTTETTGDFQKLVDEKDENEEIGWNNKAFNDMTVPYQKGAVQFTLDLKRPCDVQVVSFKNTGAGARQYIIELLDADKNVILSTPYSCVEDQLIKDVVLPETAKNAQYVRFNVIERGTYGAKLNEVHVYGSAAEIQAESIGANMSGTLFVNGEGYLKVNSYVANGIQLNNNIDATFSVEPADVITIGEKTDQGYLVKGLKAGDATITITAAGLTTTYKISVMTPIDDMSCIVYSYGPWKSKVIDVAPAPSGDMDNYTKKPDNFLNSDETDNGGWNNNILNDYVAADQSTVTGDVQLTIDMVRDCNISAMRIINSDATISEATFRFLDKDRNVIEGSDYDFTAANANGAGTDDVYLPATVRGVRYVNMIVKKIRTSIYGATLKELHLYGPDNQTFAYDGIEFSPKVITWNKKEGLPNFDYKVVGYTMTDGKKVYGEEALAGAVVTLPENSDVIEYVNPDTKTQVRGKKRGIANVAVSWTDNAGKTFTGATPVEVTTENWEKNVNIARRFYSDFNTYPSNPRDNGFTRGNPSVKIYANTPTNGASGPGSMIDGDWMAWQITAESLAKEEKPMVVLDLGHNFNINEFNLDFATSGGVQGDWHVQCGDYKVYASNATTDEKYPDAESDWEEVYTMTDNNLAFGASDRHIFNTEGKEYRYLKFVFDNARAQADGTPGDIVISEIRVGGPDFQDVEGKALSDNFTATRVLKTTSPEFDRSNASDRASDNDWIVTSKGVRSGNKLHFSYLAVDCFGVEYALEGDVKMFKKVNGVETELPRDYSVNAEGTDNAGTVNWHNNRWPIYQYNADGLGTEEVYAKVGDKESEHLKVLVISEQNNINRYAYAYDNAKGTGDWENEGKIVLRDGKPMTRGQYWGNGYNGEDKDEIAYFKVYTINGQNTDIPFDYNLWLAAGGAENGKGQIPEGYTPAYFGEPTGDRDLNDLTKAPQAASDGDFNNYWCVGYYSDGDNFDVNYKYPADFDVRTDHKTGEVDTTKEPWILYIDYRGEDYNQADKKADRYAMELDMLGFKFEGASPRDYEVQFLYCEGKYKMDANGNFERNADGSLVENPDEGKVTGDWVTEPGCVFQGMPWMGVGQKETHRVYRADAEGNPVLYTMEDYTKATANGGAFYDIRGNAVNEETFRTDFLGHIKPWNNIAAVRIKFTKPATQWGIKMHESAIYGKLNKSVMPLWLKQKTYQDAAGTIPAAADNNDPYYSFDLEVDNHFDTANFTEDELADMQELLPKVKGYEIRIVAQELNPAYDPSDASSQMWLKQDIAAVDGNTSVSYVDQDGNVQKYTGALVDGAYKMTLPATLKKQSDLFVKADETATQAEGDEEAIYGMIPEIRIHNADPSKVYMAMAVPMQQGSETLVKFNDIELNNSARTQLVVPKMSFEPLNIAIKPAEGTFENHEGLTFAYDHNEAFGGHGSKFMKANVASLRGTYSGLRVIDDVLRTWDVEYATTLDLNGELINYVATMPKATEGAVPALADTHTASLDYLELPTKGGSVESTKGFNSLKLDHEALGDALNAQADVTVTYKLGTRLGESQSNAAKTVNLLDEAISASASDGINLLTSAVPAEFTPDYAVAWGDDSHPDIEKDAWAAYMSFPVQKNDLNAIIGVKASSENHESQLGSNAENFVANGVPTHLGLPESGMGSSLETNPGWMALEGGIYEVRLDHISTTPRETLETAETAETHDVEAIFTTEYPLLLAPVASVAEDGTATFGQGRTLTIFPGQENAITVPSTDKGRAATVHMQHVAVPQPVVLTVDMKQGLATSVDNVIADGAYEIYSVDGYRVAAGNNGINDAIDALTPGIYVVRTNGKATRIVRK